MDNQNNSQPMDFSEALDAIKYGCRLAREGWNGKGMFVFLVPGSRFTVHLEPLRSILGAGTGVDYASHIDIRRADGVISVWQPSMGDLMAEDWFVVPD